MERDFKQEQTTLKEPINIVEQTLESENYEEVSAVLADVRGLQNFRQKIAGFPFGSFYEVVEVITNIDRTPFSQKEKKEQITRVIEIMQGKAVRFSPRVADLYQAMLSKIQGESYEPHFEMTSKKMSKLQKEDDLFVLFSGQVPWELKINRIEMCLLDYLSGARAFDRRDGQEMTDDIRQWRQQELKKAPDSPPERRNESQPGVDPMKRLKEGERAPAIWLIYPAWGGYYKTQSFSKWDNRRNVWFEDTYTYSEVETIPLSGNTDVEKGPIDITLSAKIIAGKWISVPIPCYTHSLHQVKVAGRDCIVRQDQNGDLVVFAQGRGEKVNIEVILAPKPNKKIKAPDPKSVAVPIIPSEFTKKTEEEIERIAQEKQGNIKRARAIRQYVLKTIDYLAPKDQAEADYYNNLYRNSPKGFAGAVDEVKKADCDVENTYGAALCAQEKLSVPTRHCVGHSVRGKNQEGESVIHTGTGHAWLEVWDEVNEEWVMMDFTSAGDPNLEKDEKESGSDKSTPGYYGEQEALIPEDEELAKLEKDLANLTEKLSYTEEERQLSEATGIELEEARQIVKEIQKAEDTKLANGERVVDVLSSLYSLIIEARKVSKISYAGPLRQREGGEEITDIVAHYLGVKSGESDPASRQKIAEKTREEKIFGGFDVYLIGDKSGSMSKTVDGQVKLQLQRLAQYLIFSSFHRFEQNLQRNKVYMKNPLSVRTQGISFRGSDIKDIDIDKPLSNQFTSTDKVTLWHSLGNQGSGNGDIAALSHICNQIKKEIGIKDANDKKVIEEKIKKDNRLRIIIACSDGEPDSKEGVHQLAEALGKLNTVVVGIGITETAAKVPIIFDGTLCKPPIPNMRGDIAKDINDLPIIVAKHIILSAIELFPEKSQKQAKQIIDKMISKFKK